MQPFKVIGIGAAFSPNLKANLYEAARLSLYFNARLVLIHVGEAAAEKEAKFKDILQEIAPEGLDYEVVFQTGQPVDVILSIAQVKQIDLLIIGAVQRENILKYYVGSIARKITRKAQCSVLLLIKPSIDRQPCEHIVVNGLEDPKTQQTLATAFYIGHQLKCPKITIVEEIKPQEVTVNIDDYKSVQEADIAKAELRQREDSRVHKLMDDIPVHVKEGIVAETQSIFGKQGYSIGHYAQLVRADLLVMNAPSKMGFWDRLFPHDIEHILTELPTDVLIVQ